MPRAPAFSDRAAVDQRRHQQHNADGRHLEDAAAADEAAIDPHDQRDRDGAEHCEGAPRASHQRLNHNQRQNSEQDDHD